MRHMCCYVVDIQYNSKQQQLPNYQYVELAALAVQALQVHVCPVAVALHWVCFRSHAGPARRFNASTNRSWVMHFLLHLLLHA
jgi:hypothetical protein